MRDCITNSNSAACQYALRRHLPPLRSVLGRRRCPGRRWPELRRDRRRARGRGGVGGGVSDRSVRQGAVLEEPCRAALGHAAEQLEDLEPEQRDEGLVAGIGQVGPPALAAAAEHAVVVDADDGADGMPSVRSSSASARSRSARVRPRSVSTASASGLSRPCRR